MSFSFIVGPGPQLKDGRIIKEYVSNMQPRVQAVGSVFMRCQLLDGVSFLFHITGYEDLGKGEFFCVLSMQSPLYPQIIDGNMIKLDAIYDGILLKDIRPVV